LSQILHVVYICIIHFSALVSKNAARIGQIGSLHQPLFTTLETVASEQLFVPNCSVGV